eukprot:10806604-Ditylum_brightwellii.AAC.1
METNENQERRNSSLLVQVLTFAPNTTTPSSKSSFDTATAAATADLTTALFLYHNVGGTATTPQHNTPHHTTPQHTTTHNNKPLF